MVLDNWGHCWRVQHAYIEIEGNSKSFSQLGDGATDLGLHRGSKNDLKTLAWMKRLRFDMTGNMSAPEYFPLKRHNAESGELRPTVVGSLTLVLFQYIADREWIKRSRMLHQHQPCHVTVDMPLSEMDTRERFYWEREHLQPLKIALSTIEPSVQVI